MALYAFFRLLVRPAFAFILPLLVVFFVLLLVLSLDADISPVHRLDLSMVVFSLVLGTLVGQTVHDVRYRFFSWTLPGFQRKLSATVIGIGLLLALIWAGSYTLLGGEMNPIAGFAGFFLIFMACAAMQRAILPVLIILLAALIWSDFILGLIRAQPVGWTAFALLGAAAFSYAGFNRGSLRKILLSPHLFLLVNMFNSAEEARATEEKLKRSSHPREWLRSFVGTEVRDWVRAVEYGSHGAMSRLRSKISSCASFALMGFLIVQPAFMNDRSFGLGLEHAFHVLFSPPVPLEAPIYVPVSLFQAIWATAFVFRAEGFLQRGWVYPVSRRQRSQVVYRMSLRQNLRVVVMFSLSFLLYGGLIVFLRSGTDDLDFMPGFFRGVIAVSILLPVLQWIRLWLHHASSESGPRQWSVVLVLLGGAFFAGLVWPTAHFWPRIFAGVDLPIQASLLVALALASQGLYYKVVTAYYQGEDLI